VGYWKRFRDGSITISPETVEKVNSFLYTYREMQRLAKDETNHEFRRAVEVQANKIMDQVKKRYERLSETQKAEILWTPDKGC
ncbi:MAG: hypothetical protein IJ131_02210, partial [Eggerthellaceae bacterium]|nr:hypothetical protein [Eggerthellaceae bacterium]MBQ9067861.1 hypothetical protein [Eggerthellaceae bacterium]